MPLVSYEYEPARLDGGVASPCASRRIMMTAVTTSGGTTLHKKQGDTVTVPSTLDMGDHEFAEGLFRVALSRYRSCRRLCSTG